MKRELERIEIPDEHEARERAWPVVRAAFAEREPQPRRRSWKPVAALAAAALVVAGLLSPPGRAVLDDLREAVGVEHSAAGALLAARARAVARHVRSGAWVVQRDGSKRLLGAYDEASWSPFGRFVVGVAAKRARRARRRTERCAGRSRGRACARRAGPGRQTDTRIVFVTDSRLHVVGGDGRGDVDAGGVPAPAQGRARLAAATPVRGHVRRRPRSRADVRGRGAGRQLAVGTDPGRATARVGTGREPPRRRRP